MTKKSTKSALFTSSISLLLCFAMLLGTTFAWFTDSVTSSGNIIKSGNLDVAMYWADGTEAVPTDDAGWTDASAGAIFNNDLWEPGYTEVRHIKIANEGTLALKYQLAIVANGEVSELSDVIDVYYTDPAAQVADRTALTDANKIGTLTEVLAGMANTASGELAAEENHTITLALKMQESAGNEYQDKSIGSDFRVVLTATQLTAEEDSFDNQYDANAQYPNFVNNNEELDVAIKAGKTNIELASGTYQIPASAKGKTLTFTGSNAADTIIEVVPAGQGEAGGQLDYNLDGSNVTFNDVTIKTNSQLYAGYARLSAVYNNCTIQNTYNLGVGNSEFNNCVFNITNEYLRVGGAYSATFNGCTFNTDGRAILVYQDGTSNAQTVTVKNCTFNATASANTWNGIHVAAVSIDGTSGTYVVNLEGTNTVDNDFNGLWQIKTGEANVTVNE